MKSPTIVQGYADRLRKIAENDQKERGKSEIDWDVQNRLDEINRNRLDDLYDKYGFPTIERVGSKLANDVFMVIHHSTDCEWNKKWISRFVEYNQVMDYGKILPFFFYRNFNEKDGVCMDEKDFIESLLLSEHGDIVKDLMDFSSWEKMYKKK